MSCMMRRVFVVRCRAPPSASCEAVQMLYMVTVPHFERARVNRATMYIPSPYRLFIFSVEAQLASGNPKPCAHLLSLVSIIAIKEYPTVLRT